MSHSKMTSTSTSTSTSAFPSLCIPWVHPNITENRIRGVFSKLDLGEIERIDSVTKTDKNDREHQRVFIHFKSFTQSDQTVRAMQVLQNKQSLKIVYDDPWFWKVWLSQSERPENRTKKAPSTPHIDFGN